MAALAPSSSSAALDDILSKDISVILRNLGFLVLVEPFAHSGVSGRVIRRISSAQDIISFDKETISEAVAKTFFEDYVVGWTAAGGIPIELLQAPAEPTAALKVLNVSITQPDLSNMFQSNRDRVTRNPPGNHRL